MCDVKNASNVTVEGVGENAGIYQWGFTWSGCNSIEVKNLRNKNPHSDTVKLFSLVILHINKPSQYKNTGSADLCLT